MANTNYTAEIQAPSTSQAMLVIFDVPRVLAPAMIVAGFRPHGRLLGAWSRKLNPDTEEAREIEYEAKGVGLKAKWWTPSVGRATIPGGENRGLRTTV